jgi:Putative ATPase subunit of terminase (gpP-like)
MGGKADNLAQKVGIGAFSISARRVILSSVIDRSSVQVVGLPTRPNTGDRRSPPRSRSLATALHGDALRERLRYRPSYTTTGDTTEIAEALNVSPYTISDWKKRKEWRDEIDEISAQQLGETFNQVRAMAPAAREVLFELMRTGPPEIRRKVAQTICEWALKVAI